MTTSSTDLKVWVKEAGAEGTAFRVFVPSDAIVDDLKKAIKKEQELQGPASNLQIKAEGGDSLDEELNVAAIVQTGVGQVKAKPFFFTQPPGKLAFKPCFHRPPSLPCICSHTPSLPPPFFL
jgi:hypothetical protein